MRRNLLVIIFSLFLCFSTSAQDGLKDDFNHIVAFSWDIQYDKIIDGIGSKPQLINESHLVYYRDSYILMLSRPLSLQQITISSKTDREDELRTEIEPILFDTYGSPTLESTHKSYWSIGDNTIVVYDYKNVTLTWYWRNTVVGALIADSMQSIEKTIKGYPTDKLEEYRRSLSEDILKAEEILGSDYDEVCKLFTRATSEYHIDFEYGDKDEVTEVEISMKLATWTSPYRKQLSDEFALILLSRYGEPIYTDYEYRETWYWQIESDSKLLTFLPDKDGIGIDVTEARWMLSYSEEARRTLSVLRKADITINTE